MSNIVIMDEWHAEWHGDYDSVAAAVTELKRLAAVPWGQEPNRAPCTNWKGCGRRYEVLDYDSGEIPLKAIVALEISVSGVVWENKPES